MSSQKKVIAIVGCGIIADLHVETIIESVKNCEIVVCDPLEGKGELLKKKYGLKESYLSLDDMIKKENPFSAHILSPPKLHVDHATKCIKSGMHVLVEKPIAFKLLDVENLYKIANINNKTICVNHSLMFQSSVQEMFKEINKDKEERILYINCFIGMDTDFINYSKISNKHWKNQMPGGTMIDTIIHPLAISVAITGRPNDININYIDQIKSPQELSISWRGENAIGNFIVSTNSKPFRRVTEVITNKRTFNIDHTTETLVVSGDSFGPKSLKKVLRNFKYSYQLSYGTYKSALKVIRKKLKSNPGARNLIKKYYEHLDSNAPLPVSKKNVCDSTYSLEKILEKISYENNDKKIESVVKMNDKNYEYVNEKPCRTLVTGASGFLGRELCEILKNDKGRVVTAQVRRGQNADLIEGENINKAFIDFSDEETNYEKIVEGHSEIIHCAHSFKENNWKQFKKANLESTIRLYEEAQKAGCKRFIFISSVAVYGVHGSVPRLVNEETPVCFGASKWDFYTKSKTLTEKELIRKAKNGGPKLLILRPGILYSVNGEKLLKKTFKTGNEYFIIIFGNGKNHLPYTRVDSVAQIIYKALNMDKFPEGVYNITGKQDENIKEFISKRIERLGTQCRFLGIPSLPIKIMAVLLESVQILLSKESKPKITRYAVNSSIRDVRYDCKKAEQNLGWDPYDAIKIV